MGRRVRRWKGWRVGRLEGGKVRGVEELEVKKKSLRLCVKNRDGVEGLDLLKSYLPADFMAVNIIWNDDFYC